MNTRGPKKPPRKPKRGSKPLRKPGPKPPRKPGPKPPLKPPLKPGPPPWKPPPKPGPPPWKPPPPKPPPPRAAAGKGDATRATNDRAATETRNGDMPESPRHPRVDVGRYSNLPRLLAEDDFWSGTQRLPWRQINPPDRF